MVESSSSLIFLTCETDAPLAELERVKLRTAIKHTQHRLRIVVKAGFLTWIPKSWRRLHLLLTQVYNCVLRDAPVLLDVRVIIKDSCGYPVGLWKDLTTIFVTTSEEELAAKEIQTSRLLLQSGQPSLLKIQVLDLTAEAIHPIVEAKIESLNYGVKFTPGGGVQTSSPPTSPTTAEFEGISNQMSHRTGYEHVAVGGTFDHLHIGHKILLSVAAWITEVRLFCGVTGDNMLIGKKYGELIEPLEIRINNVKDFLQEFRSDLELEVEPIYDAYGPTLKDSTFSALVVSRETVKGGLSVVQKRKELGLGEMDLIAVDVIADSNQEHSEKMSSTAIRSFLSKNE